jgi:predicted DNA-binding transcriptional regulator AlpA
MTSVPMQLIFTHLQPALEAAKNLDRERLPQLMADLAEVQATAQLRISAPGAPASPAPDELLNVKQAAAKLGCSVDYLYKKNFPFVVRLGRKRMFSRAGIERFLQTQK